MTHLRVCVHRVLAERRKDEAPHRISNSQLLMLKRRGLSGKSHEGSEWEMRPSDGSLSFFPWILDLRCSIWDILLVRFRGSFLLDIPRDPAWFPFPLWPRASA